MDLKSVEKYVQEKLYSDFKFVDNREKDIPFTKLTKPISQSKVALISSAGLYKKGDEPYDAENVMGDTTYRKLSKHITLDNLDIAHTHYNHKHVKADLNTVLPLEILREMEENEVIGELADINYSFHGYILKLEELIKDLSPKIAADLIEDNVDIAILAPV